MKQHIKLIRLIVVTAALIGLGIVAFNYLHKQSAQVQIQVTTMPGSSGGAPVKTPDMTKNSYGSQIKQR